MPAWLKRLGLTAYEYQCVRGVHIGEDTARRLGEEAREHGVALSIHAPYYVNLAAADRTLREKTKRYLLDSLRAAVWMGATTVVFHPGSPGEDRTAALERAACTLREVLDAARGEGLDGVALAPETTGKGNQLGSLAEVLALCGLGGNVVPAVDFGHLYARSGGRLVGKEAYAEVLREVERHLGRAALTRLHIHFSPVEFGPGGERRHRTTLEPGLGPDFAPLAELIAEWDLAPTIICESDGRQAEDALVYRDMYRRAREEVAGGRAAR
ncbi:MAG: TIM barrel protein [Firmicutes bacterium]|nr:TIM barrel protein [Bacillota bacterium]